MTVRAEARGWASARRRNLGARARSWWAAAAPLVVAAGGIGLAGHLAVTGAIDARHFLERINLRAPPLAAVPPVLADAAPPLSRRVVLVVVDGLGADRAHGLQVLDRLRARGADLTATSETPSLSRPNYVAILTGVAPADSGVRSNDYAWPVPIDSLFARVRAAGGETAFVTDAAPGVGHMFAADLSEAVQAPWENGLDHAGALAIARGYPLVVVLPGAVDRAGHQAGAASAAYRRAALATDGQLGRLLGSLDLDRDTIVVTADHGHRAAGGHGGDEREVVQVPLVLAGRGVRAGARLAREARLIDVAPTIAVLLGVPSPGHARGRALVEILDLPPTRADAIARADTARRRAIERALAIRPRPAPLRPPRALGLAALAIAGLLALAVLARARAIRFDARTAAAAVATCPVSLVALVLAAGGELSISSLANPDQVWRAIAMSATVTTAAHAVLSVWALRDRDRADRIRAAAGLGALALLVAAGAAGAVAIAAPAGLPGPEVLFLLPALAVARASAAAAIAVCLAAELVVHAAPAGGRPPM